MTTQFMIELTEDERATLESLCFDVRNLPDREAVLQNAELAAQFARSLLKRGAVPEHRLRYFTDPAYNVGGRGSSSRQVFEKNGTAGEAMLRHPHFLRHLRYFIFGADLPEEVRRSFQDEVEECGSVTSGDIEPLGRHARMLARNLGLSPKDVRERFFMLALDCGLDAEDARSIRDASA